MEGGSSGGGMRLSRELDAQNVLFFKHPEFPGQPYHFEKQARERTSFVFGAVSIVYPHLPIYATQPPK